MVTLFSADTLPTLTRYKHQTSRRSVRESPYFFLRHMGMKPSTSSFLIRVTNHKAIAMLDINSTYNIYEEYQKVYRPL